MAAIDGNNVTFVAANDVKKRKVDELKNDSVTRITPPNSDMGSLLSDKELQAILSTSKGSSVATGRAQLPTYRIDLGNHGVYIDSSATRVPKCVLNLAETILSRKSNLPTPTWEHVLESKTLLERISESEEANIQGFDPIVTPKPDYHYGYSVGALGRSLKLVLAQSRVKSFAMPNTVNAWPFLVVEFKASSRNGSLWVAENQAAGAGAVCVNSLKKLLELAPREEQQLITDSMAFSCVINSTQAAVWVHWMEHEVDADTGEKTDSFTSAELDLYNFKKPAGIVAFRSSIQNIIEWGLGERLSLIKDSLCRLLPEVPRWQREEAETVAAQKRASILARGKAGTSTRSDIAGDV